MSNSNQIRRARSFPPSLAALVPASLPASTGVSTTRAAGGGERRRGSLRREGQCPGVSEGTPWTRSRQLGPRQAKGVSQEGEGGVPAHRGYRHCGRAWVTEPMGGYAVGCDFCAFLGVWWC